MYNVDLLRHPSMRCALIGQLEIDAVIDAFKPLYDLYFGLYATMHFHSKELVAMQEIVAELAGIFFRPPYENLNEAAKVVFGASEPPPVRLLEKMLMALGDNDPRINDARLPMALCLLKFLPQHVDFFDLYYSVGVERRLEQLCSPAKPLSQIRAILRNVLAKARARCEEQRATSKPD